MSYGRPVHKLITRRNPLVRPPPEVLTWKPIIGPHFPKRLDGWEIFARQDVTIEPNKSETIETGFGIRIAKGKCKVMLKDKRWSLQNDIVSENSQNILLTINNDSDSTVNINKGDSLCFIIYYPA